MKEVKELIEEYYNVQVSKISAILVGIGGETFDVICNDTRYIFKICENDSMSHPEQEANICNKLRLEGIPVPEYVKSRSGDYCVLIHINGTKKNCHMQTYIEGIHYSEHTAPQWLMKESAKLLGKIHSCLSKEKALPMGIGPDFFEHMTKEVALHSYERSLQIAKETGDQEMICDIKDRIKIVESITNLDFDPSKLTYCNTHGDYTINQLICSEGQIVGVVDWTTACKHPVIWELVRSYLLAEPSAKDGFVDKEKLKEYIKYYMEYYQLNSYDKKHILDMYYYQIAVCDYYGQYFHANRPNKEEYLSQAKFSTKVLRYLAIHREELNEYLSFSLLN